MKIGIMAFALLGVSTSVFADPAAGAEAGMFGNIAMLGLFVAAFYFFLIRPQSKRAKEHQSLIASVAKDDEVITSGGILGRVLRIKDNYIVIQIAEGIEVTVQRQAISSSLPKGTMKTI